MTTFYLATCQVCEPVRPVPFYDEAKRDRWAEVHEQTTGHGVTVRTEVR